MNDALVSFCDLMVEKAKNYVTYLLELPELPDTLFDINNPTAIEAMQVIKAKG